MSSLLSRRQVLQIGGGLATASGLAGLGAAVPPVAAAADQAEAPGAVSPAAALDRLLRGNRRWVEGRLRHPNQSVRRRREVADGQTPFALVLSCIDSRVPPEIVFDRGVGDILVVRTPAQTLDPLVVGSVELGAAEIGVPLLLVLGHQRCGAVTAAIEAIERDDGHAPGRIQRVVDGLRPAYDAAVKMAGDLVENMVRAQIHLATARLRRAELLAPLLDQARLAIVGGRYDLDTGTVTLLSR